jgi:voltage-gated potassium channel
MPIYRIQQSGVGQLRRREWRRRVLHTVGLLLLVLAACAVGLIALDSTGLLLPAKILRGIWNALNLITTLGAFTGLDPREKLFLMATMVAFMLIGGYALSSLTGILSSDTRCGVMP